MDLLNYVVIFGATSWMAGGVIGLAVLATAAFARDVAHREGVPLPYLWVMLIGISFPVGIIAFAAARHLYFTFAFASPRTDRDGWWQDWVAPVVALAAMIAAFLFHLMVAPPPPHYWPIGEPSLPPIIRLSG